MTQNGPPKRRRDVFMILLKCVPYFSLVVSVGVMIFTMHTQEKVKGMLLHMRVLCGPPPVDIKYMDDSSSVLEKIERLERYEAIAEQVRAARDTPSAL